ncbi:MAG: hypothetical protein QOE89_3607, partial [Pseudonocardiales bacterium]|nr:hypothetical protein [Pseudonocardiales bacterium]
MSKSLHLALCVGAVVSVAALVPC